MKQNLAKVVETEDPTMQTTDRPGLQLVVDATPANDNQKPADADQKAGYEKQFLQNYRQWRKRGIARIRWLKPDIAHLAKDIVDEALAKTWYSLDSFEGKCELPRWYRVILRNTVVDHQRRAARRKEYSFGRFEHRLADDSPCAEQITSYSEMLRHVAALPERSRELLSLRCEGYDRREVAEKLGIPQGTAGSGYHKAKTALAERLS
jgi:RNA polymerase sigma factor (sigma-70 family)